MDRALTTASSTSGAGLIELSRVRRTPRWRRRLDPFTGSSPEPPSTSRAGSRFLVPARPAASKLAVANRSSRASACVGTGVTWCSKGASSPRAWSSGCETRAVNPQCLCPPPFDDSTTDELSSKGIPAEHHRNIAQPRTNSAFSPGSPQPPWKRPRPHERSWALRRATLVQRLCGRITPQRLRRDRSVFGCRPSRRAAPRSPSITHRVSVSTCSTHQRSTSAIVRGAGRPRTPPGDRDRGGDGDADRSGSASRCQHVRAPGSTARSTTFCSSRTLPGQW